jgi:hypothetical protein
MPEDAVINFTLMPVNLQKNKKRRQIRYIRNPNLLS